MQLIAAVDKHWAIGKNGQMLAVIPGGSEAVSPGDDRKSGGNGTKNPGISSRRTSSGEPD